MKIIKYIAIGIAAIVALLLIAVLTLPIWLGPVVRPTVNTIVPSMTHTEFSLGHLALNPYTGRFELGSVVLGNPGGYDEPKALSLGNLAVEVEMSSLATDTIRVEELTVEDVFVSYVTGGENGVDNFTQIQYNLAGGKEKYEAKQAKAKAKKDEAKAKKEKSEQPATSTAAKDEKPSKRVIIDRLTLNGIRLKYGKLVLPVPSITLTDIGKKTQGVTMSELCDQIWQAIIKGAMAAGDGIKALGAMLGDGANEAGGFLKNVGNGENAKKAATVVGKGASATVDAVGTGAKAVGDGVKKATDALNSLFK